MAVLPPLIDTHAHICDESFDRDRARVLARAEAAGVAAIIAVGEDLADAEKNLALARRFPILRPAAGLYPTLLAPVAADEMVSFIRRHRDRFWAVGEVGLDFWAVKEQTERAVQRKIFARFIDLARELDLPLNVHSRSAGRHAVQMLIERGAVSVQLHAFDGKFSTARPAVEAGYYFSIPPSVVRSRQKQKLVSHLPLDRLLVETDSPVLGADRAVRNEPANLPLAIRAVAEIKQVSEEAVRAAVGQNAQDLYRLV
ncbi:MAG: TatD family hydrolase [Desulfobacterales bacterium]|nr:TatD family hydrolase [Desulfobacterales bacterium]